MRRYFLFLLGLLLLLLVGTQASQAAVLTSSSPATLLLPQPHQLSVTGEPFVLNRAVRLSDPTGSALLASLFDVDGTAEASVNVRCVSADELGTFDYDLPGFENEGYRLSVTPHAITITVASKTGVIRAAQTLMQLAAATGGKYIEGVSITDYPAFKLRGFMHDVGHSFISIEELKKEIDLLSRFKVNVFHWHMTDNQGFRFESKRYPQLNRAAAMTRFAGMFYTQKQCTELEAYAAERGVIIIPEIDMPGHSKAFTTAMGYAMSSDQGRPVLKQLLSELAEAFPLTPYIHIGADEAGTTAAFVNEMAQYVHDSLHRRCMVWNPISGVNITTATLPYIDMTEMWSTSGKKISGLPNIDCRYNYVNHFDIFADLVGIYKSNIYYAEQGNSELAGAITALWNDRKTPTERDIICQNSLYANALATSERGWKGGGKQYIETGGTTLPNTGSEWEEFQDWERRFLYYKATWLSEEPIPYVRQTDVRWRITAPFPNGGDASAVFPPETATDDPLPFSFEYEGTTYGSAVATGAAVYLRHTWGTTVPAFFANPALNTTTYAWTYVYSPIAQEAAALIEFQNYGRSENDRAPDANCWDRKGSRIFLNDTELLPPAWENTGRDINAEVNLRNENFAAREPLAVSLRAGWNKVFIKLPYVPASGVRLNKWMFTFVLTTPDGRQALDNIIYSPGKHANPDEEELEAIIPGLPADGKYYHIINVQKDGTTYPLYVNSGKLSFAPANSDPSTLADKAAFLCDSLGDNKYTFRNKATGRYLIWRGNTSGGYNNNSGTLSTYNPTYCDWTLVSTDETLPRSFYLVSKRSNGTTDGSLVLMREGRFDAYSNALGFSDNYSNLFRFQEITVPDAVTATPDSRLSRSVKDIPTAYDLSGRPIAQHRPHRIRIQNGKKQATLF